MSKPNAALNRFVGNNVYYHIVNAFVQLMLTLLISRIFKADRYGDFYVVLNSFAFFGLFFSFSIDSSLVFFVAKDKAKLQSYASLAVLWALGAAAAGALFFWFYPSQNNTVLNTINAFAFILGSLLVGFFTVLATIMESQKSFYRVLLLFYLLIMGLAIKYSEQYSFFSHFYFVAVALQGIAVTVWFFFGHKIKFVPVFVGTISIVPFLKYASWAFAANLLFFLLYRADYWLVNRYITDKAAVGNYVMVSRLGQMYLMIPIFIGSSLFAFAAREPNSFSKEQIKRYCKYGCLIFVSFAIPLLIVGKSLFVFVFGESFNQMYVPFLALLPGLLALTLQIPFASYNAANNMQYKNVIAVFIGTVVMVFMNFIFLPAGSIVTAALISSIAYTICFVTLLLLSKKQS